MSDDKLYISYTVGYPWIRCMLYIGPDKLQKSRYWFNDAPVLAKQKQVAFRLKKKSLELLSDYSEKTKLGKGNLACIFCVLEYPVNTLVKNRSYNIFENISNIEAIKIKNDISYSLGDTTELTDEALVKQMKSMIKKSQYNNERVA